MRKFNLGFLQNIILMSIRCNQGVLLLSFGDNLIKGSIPFRSKKQVLRRMSKTYLTVQEQVSSQESISGERR
jgi:hypothetical protein